MFPEKYMLPADRIPDCRDQGKLDICVAMAITAVMQILHYIKTGERKQFSPTFAAAVWRDPINRNMRSLVAETALKYAIELGCPFNDDLSVMMQNPEAFNYVEKHPELYEKAAENKLISGFEILNAGNREDRVLQIKKALIECQYPVVAVVKEKTSSHCVPIIGWDDNKERFYVMNSWGDKGGAKGLDSYKYEDLKRGYLLKPAEEEKEVDDKVKILLIAGHGDGDPGAVGCGYEEAEVARDIVGMLSELLQIETDIAVDVFDINKNPYKYLKNNAFDFTKYDYVFEVHLNACVDDKKGDGKTTGTEILVHTSEAGTGVEEAILKRSCALGFKNRGVKRRSDLQNMNICKGQGVSYALLETCFIDDFDDMELFAIKTHEVVKAIVDGLCEGFKIEKKEVDNVDKFTDIKGHWAEELINEAAEEGIVNGRGDGTFGPDEFITRAEAVALIMRAREK